MKTSTIRNHRKLPSFIKEHKIFSKVDQIEKIFPLIGLPNSDELVSNLDYQQLAAQALHQHLKSCFRINKYSSRESQKIALQVLNKLNNCTTHNFIQNNKLSIPRKIGIKNINQTYINYRYWWDIDYYRNYYRRKSWQILHPLHLTEKSRIVFSSDKQKGMWDIATMSMRGIRSCQSWRGSYKRNLIGSIIDPFVGIIYLTNGDILPKGERMARRALVRYVVHKRTNEPALLIERLYPYHNNVWGFNPDIETIAIFIAFLAKKTKNQFPIITSKGISNYIIPNSKIVSKMSTCGSFADANDYCRSYRDSGIAYSRSSKVFFKNIKSF